MKHALRTIAFAATSIILATLHGCGFYSFTGASIPAEAKTVSVQYFPNQAQIVQPLLSNEMTTSLRDALMNQTSLTMVEANGDLEFEGEIVSYTTAPTAITSDQVAALNRLTIVVNVRFVNNIDESKNFEQRFTQYEDYDSSSELSAIEQTLISTIVSNLVDQIFNKALVNW